jgi:DNA-binding FrmR family transcriptional regulator
MTDTTTAPHDHAVGAHGTVSYSNHKDDVLKRLRRIEGQVRGLQRMIQEDTYCIDVLTQVSATTKALQSFALTMLGEHLACCVADAVREGGEEADAKIAEATAAIGRIMRT